MKYIEVNKKLCEGCGLCIINCSYLQEDDDGDAEAVKGGLFWNRIFQQ